MDEESNAAGSNATLRELALVVEVAERRSFTAAAEAAHMSQSALSRSVNETERRLGARLFVRTTRSVELTPEGAELVRLARGLLASHRATLNEFMLFRAGMSGSVRVAALPSAAAILLPPLVAELSRQRPAIRVSVYDTLAHIALEHLLAGEVDYAITTDDWLPDGLVFTPLTSDRFRAVFRSDHAFHGRASVTWREFAEQPLAMFGPSSSIRTHTVRVLASLGLAPASTIEAQNIAVIAGLVAAGLGIAAVPELVLPLMRFADLDSAQLVEPIAERPLGLVAVRDRPVSPAAEVFAALLREKANSPATVHPG